MDKWSDDGDEGNGVTNDNYRSEFFRQMQQAWIDGLYCDVILTCGNKSSKAHKLVLATVSEYFKSLFKYKPITENHNMAEYVMDNSLFTEQSLELILQYAYTGKITIENHNVQELAIAVNFLQIDFISNECQNFIVKNIDVDNVYSLIQFANRLNYQTILDEICLFLSKHIYDVNEKKTFLSLSVDDFRLVISNKNFIVLNHGIPVTDPELEVLRIITDYCNLNGQQIATASVLDLLACVNFRDIIDQEVVTSLMSKDTIMQDILHHSFTATPIVNTRTYCNSMKEISRGRRFGGSHYFCEKDDEELNSDLNINDRPKTFKMFLKQVEESVVLGGIIISYQSGHCIKHGCIPAVTETKQEFTLEEDEVIVKVFIRSGIAVLGLKFWTNFGRELGPFGSELGGKNTDSLVFGRTGYVHSLVCGLKEGEPIIDCIAFVWITYSSERIKPGSLLFDDDFGDDSDSSISW